MFSSVSDASVGNEATARPRLANRPLLLDPALGSASIRDGEDLPASSRARLGTTQAPCHGHPGRQDGNCRVPGDPARRAQWVAQPARVARCNNYRAGIDQLSLVPGHPALC